jgi:hypothetical protein
LRRGRYIVESSSLSLPSLALRHPNGHFAFIDRDYTCHIGRALPPRLALSPALMTTL